MGDVSALLMSTSQLPKAGRLELMSVKTEPFLSRGPPPMGTNVAGQAASPSPLAPIPMGAAFPLLMTYPGTLPQTAKASTVAANVEVLFSSHSPRGRRWLGGRHRP